VSRTWDAHAYDRVAAPLTAMGVAVLDRLDLSGDETVLDAGCGTGRVTAALVPRLPRGHIIAVDSSPAMVETARANLPASVEVREADLLTIGVERPVDAIASTATFHWILDHDGLFGRLFAALRPGGVLVAQCGGAGNLARVLAAASAVAGTEPFAPHIAGFTRPTNYATAEETAARLAQAGFIDIDCRLTPTPVAPDDPDAFLRTINLGPHVQRLPAGLVDPFVGEVIARLGDPVTLDYVRLDIDARRPYGEDDLVHDLEG